MSLGEGQESGQTLSLLCTSVENHWPAWNVVFLEMPHLVIYPGQCWEQHLFIDKRICWVPLRHQALCEAPETQPWSWSCAFWKLPSRGRSKAMFQKKGEVGPRGPFSEDDKAEPPEGRDLSSRSRLLSDRPACVSGDPPRKGSWTDSREAWTLRPLLPSPAPQVSGHSHGGRDDGAGATLGVFSLVPQKKRAVQRMKEHPGFGSIANGRLRMEWFSRTSSG